MTAPDNGEIYGLRALPPGLALADLYVDSKAWHPDVDDLNIPTEDFGAVLAAARMLDSELPATVLANLRADERTN